MRRRAAVWFAVVMAVVVAMAAPASAASVASVNTTDQDFAAAQLDDMSVTGSGESSSVTGDLGQTENVDMGSDSGQTTSSDERGLVFNVSSDRGAVFADTATVTSPRPDTMYLRYHSNGTLISSKSVSSGQLVSFEHSFVPGTEYRITVDKSGSTHNVETFNPSLPVSSGALTVTHGYGLGSETPQVFHIEDISTGDAVDISYTGAEHSADADTLFADVQTSVSTTVKAQANSGSGWSTIDSATISANQNVSLDISSSSADRYRTIVEATYEGNERTVTLEDEGVTFSSSSPTLSNPDPADGSDVQNYGGDISVDLADADFGLAQGDEVTVEASNSEGTIGETTLSSDGTASLEYFPLGGNNNITWIATDEYGNSDTLTQNFTAPDRIEVRNVSNTSELIDNVDVTIRFYQDDSDEVIEKTTTDGVISMTGLPASETYLVTARADGYVTRKAVVQPLGGQQRIYLLNESKDTAEITFELSDPTGEFPPEETYLYVEKPINESGNTTYKVITADTFGATASYTVTLETDTRYRLRVVSEGDERALGYYEASGPKTELLQIDRIAPTANARNTGVVYGSYNATSETIAVRFRGGGPETDVTYTVTDASGSTVVPETTVSGSSFAHVYNVNPQNETVSYTVDYTITHADGETTEGEFTIGELSGIADRFDIDPQVLSLASWVAILSTMGLTVIVNKTLAPAAGTSMASLLTIFGTVAIPMPLLGVSGAIAVLTIIGGR